MAKIARSAVLGLVLIGAAAASASEKALAADWRVEITVTNISRGQIISPVVIASHTAGFAPLFELGSPASEDLAAVAEDAVLEPLIATLSNDPNVEDVETLFGTGGPIMPGESASAVVAVSGRARLLSMAAMLVTTNDAFFALRGAHVPFHGTRVYHAPAYDAGSEANTESCADIPGPPCNNPGVRVPDGAEGYVHIHAGIHGSADLSPSTHDWRNPVAEITVGRLSRE